MSESDAGYHLRELELARSAGDPRRILPEIPRGCRRVLDAGCGAGQTLLACDLGAARAFGVDFDFEALRLGRRLQAPADLACSRGESLPFRSASFDFVYSRVALPYMNIPRALAEFHRVLVPGGGLWLTLHSLSQLEWKQSLSSLRRAAFECYRLLNTAALHFGAPQFRYPLRRSRCESFQTEGGMRRALARAGFIEVRLQRTGEHFVGTATRAS